MYPCLRGPESSHSPKQPDGSDDGFSTCLECNNDVWVGIRAADSPPAALGRWERLGLLRDLVEGHWARADAAAGRSAEVRRWALRVDAVLDAMEAHSSACFSNRERFSS